MLFSFIVPVYNAHHTLDRCLTSISLQTYHDFEVVAIDDGSTDTSYLLLQQYAKKDKRFKVFTQTNSGPGLTRNKAIDIAQGQYVIFLDSDDYVELDFLERLYDLISIKHPDVIMLDLVFETPEGDIIREERSSIFSKLSRRDLIASQMTGKLPWGGCRKVVLLDIIKNNALRYSIDTVGEEAIFSFDVLRFASKISFLNHIVYHYVNYPLSQSKKGNDDPWGPIVEKMKVHLEERGIYDDYYLEHNSFKISAFCVSLYRTSINHKFNDAKKFVKSLICNYDVFDIPYVKNSIDSKTKIIYLLAKYRLTNTILLLSTIKYKWFLR